MLQNAWPRDPQRKAAAVYALSVTGAVLHIEQPQAGSTSELPLQAQSESKLLSPGTKVLSPSAHLQGQLVHRGPTPESSDSLSWPRPSRQWFSTFPMP